MIFVDVNTNYHDHGGGIRTYHETKLAWFRRHPEHQYYLVVPGERYRETALADNIRRVELYGLPLGGGYRLILDFVGLYRLLRRVRADVVELGDVIWTGPFCLAARKFGGLRGLFTSFYHSDMIQTWVVPWQNRSGPLRPHRQALGSLVSRGFYRLQRAYDRTVATSRIMVEQLKSHGVDRVARMPFGVADCFLATSDDSTIRTSERPPVVKLLYSGRLGRDKGIELIERVVPRLLERGDVEVSVMGRGVGEHPLQRLKHPRYRYLGYVADRCEVAQVYREHHVLLAPGPYETFGLGILEGLASGLTVVGPNAGGAGEILRELPHGFLFQAGDADDFHRAIEQTLAGDFAARSTESQALAATYGTSDDAVGRLIAYYEQETRDETASQSTPETPEVNGPHWTPTAASSRCRT